MDWIIVWTGSLYGLDHCMDWIIVWTGSLCGLSDVDSRLICLIPLVIYFRSCPLDSYFCIVLVCELLAAFVTIFKKPYLIIIIIIIIIIIVWTGSLYGLDH